jgi:hypothetical protein
MEDSKMTSRSRLATAVLVGAAALFAVAPASFAEEQSKPPMHMHKIDMDHRNDKEVAAEYKSEAMQLREKSESHRKLSKAYGARSPGKGSANYAKVAKHCDKLAQYYDDAAKEAEGVAAELAR